MSQPTQGALEALVLEAQRRLGQLPDVNLLERRVSAAEQTNFLLWQHIPAAASGCAITISGNVQQAGTGSSSPISGATVTVKDASTGTVLGTFTTDGSGNYSGTLGSATDGQNVNVVTTKTGYYPQTDALTLACGNNVDNPSLMVAYTIPGCSCAVPATLYVTVTNQSSDGTFRQFLVAPATLNHATTNPAGGTQTAWFGPIQTTNDGLSTYYYLFSCSSGIYGLQAILLTGPSAPSTYPVATWISGTPANTCYPFAMTSQSGSSASKWSVKATP